MSVRIFGHYVSLPLVLLMLVEAAMHVGAVYLAGTLRFLDLHFLIYPSGGNYGWLLPRALLYSLVMLGVMTAFGLYGTALHKADREYQVRFLASYPAGALLMGSRARERIPRGRGRRAVKQARLARRISSGRLRIVRRRAAGAGQVQVAWRLQCLALSRRAAPNRRDRGRSEGQAQRTLSHVQASGVQA